MNVIEMNCLRNMVGVPHMDRVRNNWVAQGGAEIV